MTRQQKMHQAFSELHSSAQGPFLYDLALNYFGIYDPAARQTVLEAIPTATALIKHCADNKAVFSQLASDWNSIAPAVKAALPTIIDMINLLSDNKQLLNTIAADWQLIAPAAKIVSQAIAAKEH